MRPIAPFLTTVLLAAAGAEAKPLKIFILAGQSNMEGPANIGTFDYIGDGRPGDRAAAQDDAGCRRQTGGL